MFLKYYFQFLVILITFSGVGLLLIRVSLGRWLTGMSFRTLFTCLLSGTIFLTTLAGIYYTHGKTILTGFVPLAILFVIGVRKRSLNMPNLVGGQRQPGSAVKFIAITILAAFPVFLSFYFTIVKNEPIVPFNAPHYDYIFYGNSAYFSMLTGQENMFHVYNAYDANYHGPKAHHYLDLWTTALISALFGGAYVLNLYILAFPLLTCIALLGLLALGEQRSIPLKINLPLSFALLLFGGVAFGVYWKVPFLRNIDSFTFTILTGIPKLLVNYPFLIAGILLIERNRLWLAVLVLLCMPIASITSAPAIFGGLTILCVVNLKGKWFTPAEGGRIVLAIVGIAAYIAAFYSFFDQHNIHVEGTRLANVTSTILGQFEIPKIKTKINIVGGTVIQITLIYLPFLIAIVLLKNDIKTFFQQTKHALIFVAAASIFIAGLAAWAVFYEMLNGMQLFSNPVITTINCVCFVLVFHIASRPIHDGQKQYSKHIFPAFLFAFMICVSLVNQITELKRIHTTDQYSQEYLGKIKAWLHTQPDTTNVRGASIKQIIGYKGFGFYIAYSALGDYFSLFTNGVVPISLDNFDMVPLSKDPMERAREQNALDLSLYYRFVNEQRDQHTYVSMAQSQVDFIRKYNLRFAIIAANEKISEEMKPLVAQEFHDPVSGETFYVLK